MPTYAGLDQQGFFTPFELLQQGITAGALRRQREQELGQQQQRIGIEQQASQRANEELGMQRQQFPLNQALLADNVRQMKNNQAMQAELLANPPKGLFYSYSPEERTGRIQSLQQRGYTGDLSPFVSAHDAYAAQAGGWAGPALFQKAWGGGAQRDSDTPSSDTLNSPGQQPAPFTGTPGPNTPALPLGAPRVAKPNIGATGVAGMPPDQIGSTPATGGGTNVGTPRGLQLPPHSYYMAPKIGEKGSGGAEMKEETPGLPPEVLAGIRSNPALVQQLPGYLQPSAQKYLENYEKAITAIQDRIDKNPDVAAYIKEDGTRSIINKLNAVLAKNGDPASESYPWEKVNPVEAFSLIYGDTKSNNPGAIVRPSDVVNLETLQGYRDKLATYMEMLSGSGQKMGPLIKKELYHVALDRANAQRDQAMRVFPMIAKQASRYKVPLEEVADPDFLREYSQHQPSKLPPVSTTQVSPPSAPSGVTAVRSQAEYDALPAGASYTDGSGKVKVKRSAK